MMSNMFNPSDFKTLTFFTLRADSSRLVLAASVITNVLSRAKEFNIPTKFFVETLSRLILSSTVSLLFLNINDKAERLAAFLAFLFIERSYVFACGQKATPPPGY